MRRIVWLWYHWYLHVHWSAGGTIYIYNATNNPEEIATRISRSVLTASPCRRVPKFRVARPHLRHVPIHHHPTAASICHIRYTYLCNTYMKLSDTGLVQSPELAERDGCFSFKIMFSWFSAFRWLWKTKTIGRKWSISFTRLIISSTVFETESALL